MQSNEMQEIMNRIKNRREELGITYQTLSEKTGISKSTLQRYETGSIKNMPLDKIEIIAKSLNTTPSYIMGWQTDLYNNEDFSKIYPQLMKVKKKKIPLLGNIACGSAILNYNDLEEIDYIDTDEDVEADFAMKCVGDSMINARIEDGDLVFIDKDAHIKNGDIVAISYDNELMLKRVYIDNENNIVTLISENPTYPPRIININDENQVEFKILGKAVAFQSYL